MDDNLKQKRVLVVGMARSGVAAAKLLCALGATPVPVSYTHLVYVVAALYGADKQMNV